MIDIVTLAALLALALWNVRVRKETPECDLLDAQESSNWKGFLCVGILLHHFSSFLTQQGPLFYVLSHVGKTIVGGFFFLSGYGLMKAYGSKKLRADFLLRRTLKLMVPYWLCLLLYVLWSVVSAPQGQPFPIRQALWSLIPFQSLVFGSWYIGATLFLYILFFLGVRFGKWTEPVLLIVAAMGLFSVFVYDEWSPFFYAFPLGMLVSEHERPVLRFFRGFFWISVPALFVLVYGGGMLKLYGQRTENDILLFAANLTMSLAFALCIYGLASRVRIGNAALRFLGKYSYEIYMLHYLAMSVLYVFAQKWHSILFLACSVCLTVLLAVPVHSLGQVILKRKGK